MLSPEGPAEQGPVLFPLLLLCQRPQVVAASRQGPFPGKGRIVCIRGCSRPAGVSPAAVFGDQGAHRLPWARKGFGGVSFRSPPAPGSGSWVPGGDASVHRVWWGLVGQGILGRPPEGWPLCAAPCPSPRHVAEDRVASRDSAQELWWRVVQLCR